MKPTQEQMFYEASRKVGEVNELFMFFVRDGMTRRELERNIERRPELWGRFAGFLDKLPAE